MRCSRRFAMVGFASLCVDQFIADPLIAQSTPFICSFSWRDGWRTRQAGRRIVARPARSNDASGVPQVVDRIQNVLRFQASIEVMIARQSQDNAFATIAGGRRLIVIDTDFLEASNRRSGSDWAAIQVIAHELGHFIAGKSPFPQIGELNADYWSGVALQRLGSSKRAATSAFVVHGDDADTPTHPSASRRRLKVEKGWMDSSQGVIDYSHCERCRPA
jgi:hypothetical protein